MGRVVGSPLIQFLLERAFRNARWAFRKRAGARDLVTCTIASWMLAICTRMKIGIYLIDISGAFDCVSNNLLPTKLAEYGVPAQYLDFLNSYLLACEARVIVEGTLSNAILLADMVFQGTVLGPTLWNAFFADIATRVQQQRACANLRLRFKCYSESAYAHVKCFDSGAMGGGPAFCFRDAPVIVESTRARLLPTPLRKSYICAIMRVQSAESLQSNVHMRGADAAASVSIVVKREHLYNPFSIRRGNQF